ncbi:MAG: GDP-mannose 4,6-dehydratase [Alistipes sp.]|nr:GDP-mannose 4,6-dehydratase [Alistipes senegalensis]MCM1251159.1 GDP-mannose 4,6-dehydratase [Alistipes sp.]
MQKRVVILGGAGFIGTHLCLHLLEAGHEVFCVDIRDAADSPLLKSALQNPAFRFVRHNIVGPFGIRCDEIYNMASPSMVRYDKALPVESLKTNIMGSINALETARLEHARVVLGSSGAVYDAERRSIRTESRSDCPTHRVLAEGKLAAEALHRAYRNEYDVDTRIARIFNTYGTGADVMDQRVVMKMIVAALQNQPIVVNGNGEQLRAFCWVEDIVDGLIRLMEAPRTEHTRTLDLGSTHELPIRALAEKIIALTGSRSRIVHLPARTDDAPRRAPDITATRRELDWRPRTPLVEGLRRTIRHVEKELSATKLARMTWAEMN